MKLIEVSVRRRVTIAMFTIAIMLFGMVSFNRLSINLLPELNYPTLTVRAEYPGAAPSEVENLVTKPIEETLGAVKGAQSLRSISSSGQTDVTIEFGWGTSMDHASIDVREKLDAIFLPLEVKRPVLLRFDPSMEPIIRMAYYIKVPTEKSTVVQVAYEVPENTISDLKFLRRNADEIIKKDLEAISGVASVKVSGGLEEEVQILVDEQRLARLGIGIDRVGQILRAENVNLSGGRLEEGTQQYLVRTLNQFRTLEEMGSVVVDNKDGRIIYLRDVAEIRQSYKEREAITRLNGFEAVEIAIYKEGDANTVTVADDVKRRLSRVKQQLPKSTQLDMVYDQSVFISQAVDEVKNAGIIGGVLAMIVLFIFLRDFWATLIISISIPVSVIATFNLMYGNDISLNIMSLGGIALGIGLLVDNSIVVLENISRHRALGKSGFMAARDGASEVGTAVVASTLTTVAVFFPLVFVEGIAGQLFKDQALTVTFSLLASLLVAITLIPMMSSMRGRVKEATPPAERPEPRTKVGRGVRWVRLLLFVTIPSFLYKMVYWFFQYLGKAILWLINPILNVFEAGYQRLENGYPNVIDLALRHRALVLVLAFGAFAASLTLVPSLGLELIPSLSQGEFRVEVQFAPGTPLEKTDAAIRSIQQQAATRSDIASTFAVAGSGNKMNASVDQGGENWGEIAVVLPKGAPREQEAVVMDGLRTYLSNIPGLHYKFARPALFSFKTPIEIEVSGYELDDLKRVSDVLASKLRAQGMFADVKSTMEQGHPEIRIEFDRERIAGLGLNVYTVAETIVSKVRGDVATRYSWRDRRIDVLVRSRDEDRASAQDIGRLIINSDTERPIPLSSVAKVTIADGPSEIRRVAQQRVALVTANLNYGDLGTAGQIIDQLIQTTMMPAGIYARLGGQNEEMDSSFQSLMFALLLAVFLVYLVMASQFESLMHPFVILFTIPLALIGAILALYVTKSTVSVVVFIGLILLAGIVVNNAIVLIDLINQLRMKGMEKVEAIREAGRSRLRPILLTTLTTTLGLLPLSLGLGEGAEIRAPMGITVIGGLVISTLLTLVVIPVMYSIMDRKRFDEAQEIESALAEVQVGGQK